MVMHAGCVREQEDDIAVAYKRQRDALSHAGDVAARNDVTLCVENVFRFERTVDDFAFTFVAPLGADHYNAHACL